MPSHLNNSAQVQPIGTMHQAIDHLSAALLEVQVVIRSLERESEIDRDTIRANLGNVERDLHFLAESLKFLRDTP